MSDSAGAAARRRGRRLRAWHRHVKMAVAMELATALHHSAQPAGPVVAGPREVEEQDKYEASRRQKAPPPGAHPGVLKEPEVQLEAATVGYVAASTPLLVVASLAGGDVVDTTTINYLLQYALRKRQRRRRRRGGRKRRRRRRRRRGRWTTSSLLPGHSTPRRVVPRRGRRRRGGGKRKRGGRKSSRRAGADSFLPVVDVSVTFNDKFQQFKSYMFLKAPQLQFIDRVLDLPVVQRRRGTHSVNCAVVRRDSTGTVLGQSRCARVVQRQMLGSMVLQTVESPQLQSIEGRRRPFRSAAADPHGLDFSADSQLQYVARWSMPLLCRSFHARRCATTGAHGSDTAENCGGAAGAGPSRLWTSL